MFELNLIRDRIHIFEKRKKILYYFRLFYVVSAIALLAVVARSVIVTAVIVSNKKDLVSIREGIERDKKRYDIDRVEKEWRAFYRKAALIRDTYDNKSVWSEKLQELVSLMPQGICVNEMSLQGQNNDKMLLKIAVVPGEKQGFEIVNDVISTLEKENFAAQGVKLDGQEKTTLGDNRPLELFRLLVPLKS